MESHRAVDLIESMRDLERAEQILVDAARIDVNSFIEYAGKNDRDMRGDGSPRGLVQYPLHVEMQRLIDQHRFLVIQTFPESGKSIGLVLRAVWEIGRNPNIRICIVSHSMKESGPASTMAQQIRNYIQNSVEVKKVFPHLFPGHVWTKTAFAVQRTSMAKDLTVQIRSVGKTEAGPRYDWYIVDDAYNDQNTRSQAERDKLFRWLTVTMLTRLTPGGRVTMACNPWHPDDPAMRMLRVQQERPWDALWHVRQWPVYTPPTETDMSKVTLTLPEFYPLERIDEKRKAAANARDFARSYLCLPQDESESPFSPDDVYKGFAPESEGGCGVEVYEIMSQADQVELGMDVVVGVDLAMSKKKSADKTVFAVVGYWRREGVCQLLYVEGGRWRGDEIAARLLELDKRFRPKAFIVEDNAAQKFIFDVIALLVDVRRLMENDSPAYPPVIPITTTGKNKYDPCTGVEAISGEISRGKWLFPGTYSDGRGKCHADLSALKYAMIGYTRGAHTGDHLMALWFAREGIRSLVQYRDPDEEWEDDELRFDPDRFADDEPRDEDAPVIIGAKIPGATSGLDDGFFF